MKIFGREPAAWVALIEAAIALVVAIGLDLTNEQVALIMAVVTAGFGFYTAWVTRDTLLGVAVGFTKAVLALAIGFGFELSPEVVGAIVAFVTVATGLFQRTQTTPVLKPGFKEPDFIAP